MARSVLIEEFHLHVYVPHGLPEQEADAVRRTLDSARFQARVTRAVRAVLRRYRTLRKVSIALTR